MPEPLTVLLFTHRPFEQEHGTDPGPEHEKENPAAALEQAIARGLQERAGADLIIASHLYDLPPDGPTLKRLRAVEGNLVVLAWLYPRSAYWLLDANGIPGRLAPTFSLSAEDLDSHAKQPDGTPPRTIWCFDLREKDDPQPYLDAIAKILDSAAPPPAAPTRSTEIDEPVARRWYPVIDYGRCTNCLECLNFCLFGVFGLDASEEIIAEEPDACRAGCPACSRICPAGAIMFPQHADPGIGGDPKASLDGLKLDLSQLFGGIDPAQLAAEERDRALAQRQEEPPDKDDLDDLIDQLDDMDL